MSERSEARRAVARRLHPDLGGDPQEYMAAMARLDDQFGPPGATPVPDHGEVHTVRRRRPVARLTASAGRAVTTLRTKLPRSWPGARRYGRL